MTVESNRKSRLAVVFAALAFYLVFIFRTSFVIGGTRYFVLFEDAMISMRYARNFAETRQFAWNVGEPPIEGFTNLLWTLWMSVAHTVGLSESKVSLFIMLTGVAVMLANGHVAQKIAKRLTDAPWVPLAVLAAVLFDYPLVFWTLRGMEVGALSLIVYTLLWLVLENEEKFSIPRTFAIGILGGAALLLRSDSVVPVGLIGLYGLYTAEKRVLFAVILGGTCGATLAGQSVFRAAHFHEKLPNTYYLKLFHIPLSARLKRGAFVALQVLTMHLAVPIAAALAAFPGMMKPLEILRDKKRRRILLLVLLFSAQIGYATFVGGDAWEWMLYANRYTCIGMPALILLVALVFAHLAEAKADVRERFVRRFGFALLGIGGLLLALQGYARFRPEQGIAATIVFGKTAAAMGGALVLLGGLFFLKDMREALAFGLSGLARRTLGGRSASKAALVLTLLVWLPCHLLPLGRWAAQNAAQYKDEARYTRIGLLIDAATPKDLRIAVAAAGATPYFCRRPTEDLLGKNDRFIARLAPRGVFSPGHDKWDYAYSLGERNARLIVELVDKNDADDAYLDKLGFETLPNDLRLRQGTPGINRDVLSEDVPDGPSLAAALARASYTLPEGLKGVDVGMVLAFALLIGFVAVRAARDVDDYSRLLPEPPAEDPTSLAAEERDATSELAAKQIPVLDGLRGIAVLAVLAFHFAWTFPEDNWISAKLHEFLWSGWTGVDLFFVLSGFLITRGLVAPSKKPLGIRMKMFWMRRVLRIFPLYYAVLIVGAIVAVAMHAWIPTWPYWLYMQNYALAFDHDVLRWTAHFWSLAIEEQFYFVWPIVALVTPRKRIIPLILVSVVACVLLRAGIAFKGNIVDALTTTKFVYRATFTRCDGLLLGALAAVLQRESMHPVARTFRRLRMPILVATGLAIVGLYVMCHGLNDYDRRIIAVGYFILALFFATVVSVCADAKVSPRVKGFLESRLLVACGKVSYGMYIFHWAFVVWAVPHLEKVQIGMAMGTRLGLGLAVIVAGLVLSYVLATISFRFFETPFLKLKGKFHD